VLDTVEHLDRRSTVSDAQKRTSGNKSACPLIGLDAICVLRSSQGRILMTGTDGDRGKDFDR
jgi:hypothetical protein